MKGHMVNHSFEAYAHIYDAFYVDKNYEKEFHNLYKIAESLTHRLNTGLEIGAGSGTFTKQLATKLTHIEAYEISPAMASICASNLSKFENIKVSQGDLRQTLDSHIENSSIDIVIANFHVFTYFTNIEVDQFLQLCRNFLRTGGIVSFDFWDLEAVIASPPKPVLKVAYHEGREIERKTFPSISENYRKVEINFEFYESNTLLFAETHFMYPRSLDEIREYFANDFEFCGSFDISSGEPYSRENYGNLVYFRKN